MEREKLLERLERLLGADHVQASATSFEATFSRGGWQNAPLALLQPQSTEPIAEIVSLAEEAGVALVPTGAGTKLHTGYPPSSEKPYLLLQTNHLNRITDYQPDDLTVTCEAGTPLHIVQERLAHDSQFLALDVPLSTQATLGGIVSSGTTGFWRASYGSPRDLVIGLQAVIADGKIGRAHV